MTISGERPVIYGGFSCLNCCNSFSVSLASERKKERKKIHSAICHFVRIRLFIACTPPAGSSNEHVFFYREMEQPKSGDVT